MTTTNEATKRNVMTELEAFRDRVLRVSLRAKKESGWCDEGYNKAMTELGFRPVTSVYVPAVYEPEEVHPTRKVGREDSDCPDTCDICWDNPRGRGRGKLVTPAHYEFRYTDGDEEPVTFADGTPATDR